MSVLSLAFLASLRFFKVGEILGNVNHCMHVPFNYEQHSSLISKFFEECPLNSFVQQCIPNNTCYLTFDTSRHSNAKYLSKLFQCQNMPREPKSILCAEDLLKIGDQISVHISFWAIALSHIGL